MRKTLLIVLLRSVAPSHSTPDVGTGEHRNVELRRGVLHHKCHGSVCRLHHLHLTKHRLRAERNVGITALECLVRFHLNRERDAAALAALGGQCTPALVAGGRPRECRLETEVQASTLSPYTLAKKIVKLSLEVGGTQLSITEQSAEEKIAFVNEIIVRELSALNKDMIAKHGTPYIYLAFNKVQ